MERAWATTREYKLRNNKDVQWAKYHHKIKEWLKRTRFVLGYNSAKWILEIIPVSSHFNNVAPLKYFACHLSSLLSSSRIIFHYLLSDMSQQNIWWAMVTCIVLLALWPRKATRWRVTMTIQFLEQMGREITIKPLTENWATICNLDETNTGNLYDL